MIIPREKPWHLSYWVIAVASMFCCLAAILSYQRWTRPQSIPLLGPKTMTIVPGVHMLRGIGPSVAYVIETSEGPILIDSGLEANAAPLKEEMARLLLDWRSVKAVLLTHIHGDHSGGAEYLRKEARAKIYAGKGDADVLRAGGPKEAFFSAFYMPKHSPHKTNVDVELEGEEKLVFGDVTIEAVGTPGHTPGSICYLLNRGGKTLFFSGDVIMHLGEEKPLGTYSTYLAPKYRGDPWTYQDSLKFMDRMSPPNLVLPGHPPLGPNFDDPTELHWHSVMNAGVFEMATLITREKADGADFLDDEPKEISPGLLYLGDLAGVSIYAIFQESRFILIDAPGGDKLIDFVSSRLQSLTYKLQKPSAVWLTSCSPDHISGLKTLVETTGAEVVTTREGLGLLKRILPANAKLTACEDLQEHGSVDVKALAFRGREPAPAAYVLKIPGRTKMENKTVLISGRIPLKFGEELTATLASSPVGTRDEAVDTLYALSQLEPIHPDIWLPSRPWHGQNANLYDQDWDDLIAAEYRIEYFKLRRANAIGKPKGLSGSPTSAISSP